MLLKIIWFSVQNVKIINDTWFVSLVAYWFVLVKLEDGIPTHLFQVRLSEENNKYTKFDTYKNDIDESWMKRTRSSWPQEGAILADFWGFWIWNNENKSCLNDQILRGFRKSKNKQILKVITALSHVELRNLPRCPNQEIYQDDMVLWL